jgi:hypothetical protein
LKRLAQFTGYKNVAPVGQSQTCNSGGFEFNLTWAPFSRLYHLKDIRKKEPSIQPSNLTGPQQADDMTLLTGYLMWKRLAPFYGMLPCYF